MFTRRRTGRPVITLVAAARPNFMKVAPVLRALQPDAHVRLVHTGQHYDDRMSASFFRDLDIPEPDINLGVGSGTHAEQTAGVLVAMERQLKQVAPDAVVVVGDVNSTVAAALAATKLHIPVAHVEAGLRSHDWEMPEEVNRVVTDRISRWLYTTSEAASATLLAEGVPQPWVHFVGNVMIDTLLAHVDEARARGEDKRRELGLADTYGVLTLHRPSNVDGADALKRLLAGLQTVTDDLQLVFPAHPRTLDRLSSFGIELPDGVVVTEPMGYLDFIGLVSGASVALTDSGGLQEETSVLGVPCVTLRENTERPITCELGTNVLVGTDTDAVVAAFRDAMQTGRRDVAIPLWDGHAADRIAQVLLADLHASEIA